MRNSRGGTPASAKKSQRNVLSTAEKNSAKKLVQARLPFKVIAPGSPSADEGSIVIGEYETQLTGKLANDVGCKESTETRKRKLSYESDSGDKDKDVTDNVSKENVKVKGAANKKKKTGIANGGNDEVITLLDDDVGEPGGDSSDAVMDTSASTSKIKTKAAAKTPKESKKTNSKGAGTPKTSSAQKRKNGSASKLTIKLPTSVGKKNKRRKSKVNSLVENVSGIDIVLENIICVYSSDDIEEVASELNPQKRTKLDIEGKENNAEAVNNKNMESITAENNKGTDQNSILVASTLDSKVGNKPTPSAQETEKETNSTTNKRRSTRSVEHNRQSDKIVSSTAEHCVQKDQEELAKEHDESFLIPSDDSDDAEADEDADDETETRSCNHKNVSDVIDENLKSAHNDNLEFIKNSNESDKHKNLTPKQKKLMERRLLARQEKELKLLEEKKKKQQEKEEKELAKKREREEKEDHKRKEREEKEEQRRKEREEKESTRLAEIEAKNEEKRKRNEAKEEELRKREDERKRKELEKEESELKKKKAAQAFTKFFVAKGSSNNQQNFEKDENTDDGIKLLAFRPFQIKGDMKLAPLCRKILTPEAKMSMESQIGCYRRHNNYDTNQMDNDDQDISKTSPSFETKLYLQELKSGQIVPGKWRRPSTESKDDVILVDELERVGQEIVEDSPAYVREEMRVKFYKFHDNRRPPYYGTFRKKSLVVSGRKPFAQDKIFCDYEVDSDDEWEEEEPGESLEDGSDEDKEKDSDDEYEVDNEWFVPHGHLSEEELQNEDECDIGSENTREAQKAKLQLIQQEFAQEMKKKTEKIKPRLIGCIWADVCGNQPQGCPNLIWETLGKSSMLLTNPPEVKESKVEEPTTPPTTNAETKLKPIVITEEMAKDLVRLVHGNINSKNFLIQEYMAYLEKTEESIKNGEFCNLAKSAVRDKIDTIAEWQVVVKDKAIDATSKNKKIKKHLCWVVHSDMLNKMNMSSLKLDNAWEYILTPRRGTTIKEAPESFLVNDDTHKADDKVDEKAKTEKTQITKFTKVVSKDTSQSRHSEQSAIDTIMPKAEKKLKSQATSPQAKKEKKRVPLLMSVARGQQISTPSKNKLISQFLQKGNKDSKSSASQKSTASEFVIDDDDIVALD